MTAPIRPPFPDPDSITPDSAPSVVPTTEAELLTCLQSWAWRIYSGQLYKILVKEDDDDEDSTGLTLPFMPNRAQRTFLDRVHNRNTILKARQLGFSTLICILWLDHALFNPDQACGIVAQDLRTAKNLLRYKVRFAYEQLPAFLRASFPLVKETAETLEFGHNGSRIEVGASLRGGTFQRLHVSELGKISAKFPEKAKEVMTGTLPTVPTSGVAVIESTAEGKSGAFYENVQRARRAADSGKTLAKTDFRFHFFPWWDEPAYAIDPAGVMILPDDHKAFDEIEQDMGCLISNRQRAWYVSTRENAMNGDQELMWREYPSTPDEAFQTSTAGAYLARQMASARIQRRITSIPHAEGVPVHTFWDIGAGDGTGIWCMQRIGLWTRWLRYIEGWDHGYAHYVRELKDTGWIFGRHFLPHDGRHKRQMGDKIAAPIDLLEGIAPDWRFEIVPRVSNIQDGIQLLRSDFPEFQFDEEGCAAGLAHLDEYRKVWNARQGTWGDQPEKKDGHSEAADAIRQYSQAKASGINFDSLGLTKSRPTRRRMGGMVV